MRELRNETAHVIAAVRAGQQVTLTLYGQPIADIIPHQQRSRWLPGAALRDSLREAQADPALSADLAELAGDTLADL